MQLTQFSDIGLRSVMFVMALDGERTTTREISTGIQASPAHVAKAVARLVDLGVLETSRGRGGGVWLSEKANRTTVGTLVRAFEADRPVVDCTNPHPCPLLPECTLNNALDRAQEAFYSTLDGISLRSIAVKPGAVARLNLLPTPPAS